MNEFLLLLPSASISGLGMVLCLIGYKTVRFHALTVGVCAFSALGGAAGARMDLPLLAAALALAGGCLGYGIAPLVFPVYIAVAAAAGGSFAGVFLCLVTGYSNPPLLIASTAAGFAVLALLDARFITILWTSFAGATQATVGILWMTLPPHLLTDPAALGPALRRIAPVAGSISLALLVSGVLFQSLTTRERSVPAPALPPVPHRVS